jgi:hypothetical protein
MDNHINDMVVLQPPSPWSGLNFLPGPAPTSIRRFPDSLSAENDLAHFHAPVPQFSERHSRNHTKTFISIASFNLFLGVRGKATARSL